jgi:hypothetical protein
MDWNRVTSGAARWHLERSLLRPEPHKEKIPELDGGFAWRHHQLDLCRGKYWAALMDFWPK